MRAFGWSESVDVLAFPSLIEALRRAFRSGDIVAPAGRRDEIAVPNGMPGTLSLAPAWQVGDKLGVRVLCWFPGLAADGENVGEGAYVLFEARAGKALARPIHPK